MRQPLKFKGTLLIPGSPGKPPASRRVPGERAARLRAFALRALGWPRDGLRLALLASLCLLSSANLSLAQYPGLSLEDTQRQKLAIESERRAHFHRAWALAGPERRASVSALLARRAAASAVERDQPELQTLAWATRLLLGVEELQLQNAPLTRLADGIDVFCPPVDLKAEQTPAEGQVITVGVRLLSPMSAAEFPPDPVRLSLVWQGADGERLESRGAEYELDAFQSGFPVALRTPPDASGTWQLVPSLSSGGRQLYGWGVQVPFVTRFKERVDNLQRGTRLMGELSYLLKWGRIWVRRSDRLGPAEWLRSMEAGEVGGTRWSADLLVRASGPKRPVVLLVASSREAAAGLLVGPSGEAWLRVAEEQDLHLACADAKELTGGKLPSVLADLVRETGGEQLILVARGDAGLALKLVLPQHPAPELKALVLVNSFGALAPESEDLPTLLVGCSGDRESDAAHVTRIDAPPTLLLADTSLAEHFQRWFTERWPR